jgi:hypothetical protein
VEFRLDDTISDAFYAKFKEQASALDTHVQGEVKIIEFDTFRCGQSGE